MAKIAAYTQERWGERQKAKYMAQLQRALQNLLASPDTGAERNDIAPGIQALKASSHVVLYRATEVGVEVARVLHQRMDPKRHLD